MQLGLDIFPVELSGGGTVGVDLPDVGGAQDRRQVVGRHVFDAAVAGTDDVAAVDHVPEGDAVIQQQAPFFLDGLRDGFAGQGGDDAPEAVLGMVIEKHALRDLTEGKEPRIRISESARYSGAMGCSMC